MFFFNSILLFETAFLYVINTILKFTIYIKADFDLKLSAYLCLLNVWIEDCETISGYHFFENFLESVLIIEHILKNIIQHLFA